MPSILSRITGQRSQSDDANIDQGVQDPQPVLQSAEAEDELDIDIERLAHGFEIMANTGVENETQRSHRRGRNSFSYWRSQGMPSTAIADPVFRMALEALPSEKELKDPRQLKGTSFVSASGAYMMDVTTRSMVPTPMGEIQRRKLFLPMFLEVTKAAYIMGKGQIEAVQFFRIVPPELWYGSFGLIETVNLAFYWGQILTTRSLQVAARVVSMWQENGRLPVIPTDTTAIKELRTNKSRYPGRKKIKEFIRNRSPLSDKCLKDLIQGFTLNTTLCQIYKKDPLDSTSFRRSASSLLATRMIRIFEEGLKIAQEATDRNLAGDYRPSPSLVEENNGPNPSLVEENNRPSLSLVEENNDDDRNLVHEQVNKRIQEAIERRTAMYGEPSLIFNDEDEYNERAPWADDVPRMPIWLGSL